MEETSFEIKNEIINNSNNNKNENNDIKITPMPWKKLSGGYVLLLCEAISITSFFTYVSPFIIFLNVTNDKEKIGYYAGFIASVFSLSQFLSSFFWGKMSDKYGRKPILMLGSIGSIISLLCVGTSFSLPILIGSRAINGLLNGNVGVIKTYIGECTDKTNQVEAFGLIGLTFGLGSIIGSSIGGVLTNPVESIPSIFGSSSFFKHFPFLLTNLAIALLTLTGCLFVYFFMNETLPMGKSNNSNSKSNSINLLVFKKSSSTNIGSNQDIKDDNYYLISPQPIDKSLSFSINSIPQDNDERLKNNAILIGESFENISKIHVDESESNLLNNIGIDDYEEGQDENTEQRAKDDTGRNQNTKIEFQDVYISNISDTTNKDYQKLKVPKNGGSSGIFRNKLIVGICVLYGCVGLINTMFDETFPIWAYNKSSDGGLGLTTAKIGICGAISGVGIIFIQIFLIKPVSRRFGIIKTFTIGCSIGLITFILVPSLNYITPLDQDTSSVASKCLFWFLVILVSLFRNVAAQFIFTPVNALINNSAKVTVRGSANGLGQSLVALTRAIAPPFAGTLLSWSLTNNQPFPLNHYFVFLLMSLLSIIPIVVATFFLPLSLNAPMIEVENNNNNKCPIDISK